MTDIEKMQAVLDAAKDRHRDRRKDDGNTFYTWGHFLSGFTPRPLGDDAPRVAYWPISAPLEDE